MAENPNYQTGQKPTATPVFRQEAVDQIKAGLQAKNAAPDPAQQINNAMQNASQQTPTIQPQAASQAVGSLVDNLANQVQQRAAQQPSAQTQANAQTTQEATGQVYFVGANGSGPKGMKVGDQVVTASGTYTVMGVNPDGSYQSKLTNANQNTGNYAGAYANHTGNVYQVGSDSNAPKGLKVGDQVVTGGGTYTITGVNADGSYSKILSNRGQTTANFTGQYATAPGTAPATQQPAVPNFAQPYQSGIDYSVEIQKALERGDLAAAAYFEQQRNAKIDAEGLGNQYAKTNQYSQYLSQLTPERQAQLMNGYVRESKASVNPATTIQELLDQWKAQAEAAAQNKINYGVEKGVNEAQRAYEDALPQFQQQLDQNDIDTARAMANSAFYAEARGDRGGIGQSQYNEIQAAALKNKQAINTARTKLATDTARQIADYRAQGEFQKADQLLTIGQQYLQQLISLEQWGADWQMSQEQMARELEQWEKNYELNVANSITGEFNGKPTYSAQKYEQENLAARAEMKIKMGVMPTAAELAAIGMTEAEAAAAAWNLSGGAYSIGSGGGNFSSGDSYSSGGGGSSYSSTGSGSGTPYTPPQTQTPVKAPNAALTYTQPKNSAPTPWQKPVEGYDM